MGIFNILFGSLMGYSPSDVARWERTFPDGVTRCAFAAGGEQSVSILDAIRHVQNSHGWSADDSCEHIAGELACGRCVPTGCGRYFYVHKPSFAKANRASKASGQEMWNEIIRRLCLHGMPQIYAVHLAAACLPSMAETETRQRGAQFARPVVSPANAVELVDYFLAIPRPTVSQKDIVILLEVVFGHECVERWIDEVVKAYEKSAKEHQQAEEEATYQAALATLGVPAAASREEVTQRYRILSRKYHPDHKQNASDSDIQAATKKLQEINEAYRTLLARMEKQAAHTPHELAPTQRPRDIVPREKAISADNSTPATDAAPFPTALPITRIPQLLPSTHDGDQQNPTDLDIQSATKNSQEINEASCTVLARVEKQAAAAPKELAPIRRPRHVVPREKANSADNGTPSPYASPSPTAPPASRIPQPPPSTYDGGTQEPKTRPGRIEHPLRQSVPFWVVGSAIAICVCCLLSVFVAPEGATRPESLQPNAIIGQPDDNPRMPTPPDAVVPRAAPSKADALSQAVATARNEMANNNYLGAYETLHALFTVTPPATVRDPQLWQSYLIAYSKALNGITPKNTYKYWNSVHENGVAWHECMKQALAAGDIATAKHAYQQAADYYKRVAKSSAPASRDDRGLRILAGLAMENDAVARLQLANFSRDSELYRDAHRRIKECWAYLAAQFGQSSQEYQTSVAEWEKQVRK
jgi:hypothetical protein